MKSNRAYKTISLYFSEKSIEDQMILSMLIQQNKVGTSISGLIKQILYKELVENENTLESQPISKNKKNETAIEINKMFEMGEI